MLVVEVLFQFECYCKPGLEIVTLKGIAAQDSVSCSARYSEGGRRRIYREMRVVSSLSLSRASAESARVQSASASEFSLFLDLKSEPLGCLFRTVGMSEVKLGKVCSTAVRGNSCALG
jgi:hypothetical protein